MLTEKQFQGLKKANLSVDADKSRERISGDFKNASPEIKNKIIKLSGLTRATFYNAFQRGTASPKMVLALAQLMGTSPYYYTGEEDERSEFNSDILKEFVSDKKLAIQIKKTVKMVKNEVVEPVKKASIKSAQETKKVDKSVKSLEKQDKTNDNQPPKETPIKAKAGKKPIKESGEILMQISIEKTEKLQKAVANLDEESAILLLRALIKKSESNDNARALCEVVKSCLLS